ncbi:adenosylcobalamin-dependent ribonucleoside-diphosphate reductase [Azospirillum sp. SYSU D00513]|uniref:adenosylcobalamin-dependent ribonucleoside-diphosphate reductase n=1 Tax=Azospirillum sp. SYSU D00513 TaxID=2812561 RepID=UPI001A965ED9|nr:adenosylcobalamin-dependent ribonucleoside-diphosphate reductase [Azospirillum sp. SYSU D00513]
MDMLDTALPRQIWLPAFRRQRISTEIQLGKYAQPGEHSTQDIHRRVVSAVLDGDPRADEFYDPVLERMNSFELLPAGRILAGAGSERQVTWINCFVNRRLEDSMVGIMGDGLLRMSVTLQRGGGMGTDFSPIRPKGAYVAGTGTPASGVISFALVFDQAGKTVESAGERRGAQMGTLRADHPDIFDFIDAKRVPGQLRGLNLSVLVTDAFMAAINADADFDLGHPVRPFNEASIVEVQTRDGQPWYVYKRVKARDLWDRILRATYAYAEPGVIFIDRVNRLNNLSYIESIISANPCGEQMLPENGACVLGQNWLPIFVRNAFTPQASFDFDAMSEAAGLMVRVLDNVIDRSPFPWPEQRQEAQNKRRIGIGTPGVANCLMMLGLRYGSKDALKMLARIKRAHRDAVYRASVNLAKERGPFPMFQAEEFLSRPFVKRLPEDIREGIALHGIRNGVLLSEAPTGTTGLYVGNLSSGIEPVFAFRYIRNRRVGEDVVPEEVYDAGYVLYCDLHGLDPAAPDTLEKLPSFFVDAQTLTARDHVLTQAVCQRYVDSSISKTVNLPEDTSFEAFKDVYDLAFATGCKGCTTYRPNPVTGSVLQVMPTEKKEEPTPAVAEVIPPAPSITTKLPDELESKRLKVRFNDQTFYLNVSRFQEPSGRLRAVEVFVSTDSLAESELATAMAKLLSHILRFDADPLGALAKLKSVSGTDVAWVGGRMFRGLVSLIAHTLETYILSLESTASCEPGCKCHSSQSAEEPAKAARSKASTLAGATRCASCGEMSCIRDNGCERCLACGTGKCS